MKDRVVEAAPGDQGRWYLHMLGLDSDGGPSTLQEVARNRESQQTSAAPPTREEPATAAQTVPPMGRRRPYSAGPAPATGRRFKWPMLLLIFAIAVAALLTLWWLPQASNQRAATHAELMQNSIAGLYSDLAGLQQSLATATDPASSAPDLGTVALGLSGVADSAARLLDVADEPVPSALPLSPRQRFDALELFRLDLGPLAAEATSIRSEVEAIAAYRLSVSDVLATGELPLTADSALVNAQTDALANTLADSVAALNEMAADGPFAAHRQLIEAEVSGFAQWQADYLDALRSDDPEAAGELVETLRLAKEGISSELVRPLAELRSELDSRILALAERLTAALGSIPA